MFLLPLARLLFWFGLIAWICAITAAGIAAAHAFPMFENLAMTLHDFAAYKGADSHGEVAAGLLLRDIFVTTGKIQILAAVITGVGVLLEGLTHRSISGVLRILLILGATIVLGWYLFALRPEMATLLETKWSAAQAGDLAAAAAASEQFDPLHDTARLLHEIILFLLLAVAALAATNIPHRKVKTS